MTTTHHIWTVLCHKSLTDKESNNMSLIEVFERLTIDVGEDFLKKLADQENKGPVLFRYPFEVVSLWYRGERPGQVELGARIEAVDPTGKVLSTFDYPVKIVPEIMRQRVNIKFPGVQITKGGIYWFRVSMKGDGETYAEITSVPLEVVINFPKTQ